MPHSRGGEPRTDLEKALAERAIWRLERTLRLQWSAFAGICADPGSLVECAVNLPTVFNQRFHSAAPSHAPPSSRLYFQG